MTDKELKKLHVINCALERKITVAEAANALGLSERRIKQLKKEVKEHGVESIIHGNRGRKPSHSINDTLALKIIELKSSYKYQDTYTINIYIHTIFSNCLCRTFLLDQKGSPPQISDTNLPSGWTSFLTS